MIRQCSQQWLDRRCREAGKSPGECNGCIVEVRNDGVLIVDENHADYPLAAVSLLQKAKNFASSVAAHVSLGMPKATQEQIDQRFEICKSCSFFDGKACMKCGCPIVRERTFISKLGWANEKCPEGKWGPID